MLTTRSLFIGFLLTLPALCFGQLNKAPLPSPAAEDYQKLLSAYQRACDEFDKAYRAAKSDKEREQVLNELGRKSSAQSHTEGFRKLVQRYPDDPVALAALQWLFSREPYGQDTAAAVKSVGAELLRSDQIMPLCRSLSYYSSPPAIELLRSILKHNHHRAVQGQARFSLALGLKREGERCGQTNPETASSLNREAERLLEEVLQSYGDVKIDQRNLADAAAPELFELRNLAVGKAAPEIEGEDLDGKQFKLSEYRGKIVLVDFWGTW